MRRRVCERIRVVFGVKVSKAQDAQAVVAEVLFLAALADCCQATRLALPEMK
jgi:hypothetical protein